VITDGNTTYTVNGASFVALEGLSIATADKFATLSDGKVSLKNGAVSSVAVTDGDTISATKGTVTVDVDGSTVTIGDLNNAEVFNVSGTSYLKTSIGLATGDTKKLNKSLSSASVTTADLNLSGSDWKNVLNLNGSTLSVDISKPSDVFVVDLSTKPANALFYGELTKNNDTYTLDNTGTSTLDAVTVTGTKLTLPAKCTAASLSAGGATFTVTAPDAFTIDASNNKPAVSGVTSVYLTAGELVAPYDVPVNVNGKAIVATNSSAMTIGISGASTFVGELNVGDTFTIGGTSYTMTRTGLLKGDQIVYPNTATFYLDNEDPNDILIVKDTNLDLTSQTEDANVYNEANTMQIGTLSFVGSKMSLYSLSSAPTTAPANIKTVNIAPGANFTVNFDTKVNATSGIVTVNDDTYNAVGSIVIDAKNKDSTLYNGTIALASGYSVASTNDDTVKTDNGTINVTAALGKVTQFSELDTGDSFSFGGKSYVQADMGLMLGDQICESLNGSFTAANLNNGKFVDILTPVDSGLDLSTITADANIYDDADSPAVKYAALTVSRDNTRYTLTDSGSASTAIETVDITAGKILTVDFSTMVNAPTGTVTVNGDRYNAAGSIVLSAVKNDSTLYDGIVTLDKTNPTASATYNGALTVSNASISATATLGYFTAISGLSTGESFTFDGTTYTQTDIGLRNGSFVAEALSGSEIALDDLETVTWNNFLTVGSDGVLTLADVTTDDANVYNYAVTE
ncbi:MAG: hypothetical protein IKD80_06135, partial [Selenomonadaceae bacterium]|nr:hypothetical protein [Selenomonadaceae bacterium]